MVENGPVCPALVKALPGWPADLVVFYSYRYYQSFFGLPAVTDRAVLVPTAEEDPAVELPVFGPLFRAPRGILYLTPEERSLVNGVSGNESVPVRRDRQRHQRARRLAVGGRARRDTRCPSATCSTPAASTATRARTSCSRTTGAWRTIGPTRRRWCWWASRPCPSRIIRRSGTSAS